MKREKAGFFLCFKKIFSEDIFFFSENVFAKRQDISETFSLSVRLCRYDFRIDDDCVVLCKKNILFIEITRKIFAESIFFVYFCRVINL